MGRRRRAQKWDGQTGSGRRVNQDRVCGKKPFDTREDAERELRRYRQKRDADAAGFQRLPTQVQDCEICGCFHITGAMSKPAPAGRLRRRRKGGMGWK